MKPRSPAQTRKTAAVVGPVTAERPISQALAKTIPIVIGRSPSRRARTGCSPKRRTAAQAACISVTLGRNIPTDATAAPAQPAAFAPTRKTKRVDGARGRARQGEGLGELALGHPPVDEDGLPWISGMAMFPPPNEVRESHANTMAMAVSSPVTGRPLLPRGALPLEQDREREEGREDGRDRETEKGDRREGDRGEDELDSGASRPGTWRSRWRP